MRVGAAASLTQYIGKSFWVLGPVPYIVSAMYIFLSAFVLLKPYYPMRFRSWFPSRFENYYEDRVPSVIDGITHRGGCVLNLSMTSLCINLGGEQLLVSLYPTGGHEWTLGGEWNEVKLHGTRTTDF